MTAISGVEFLIWLLIAASTIAVLTKYLRIPYTVAFVLGGLLLSPLRLPFLSPLQLPALNVRPVRFWSWFHPSLQSEHLCLNPDIRTVSKALGHKSLQVTERFYAKWNRAQQDKMDDTLRTALG
jgi:integrase